MVTHCAQYHAYMLRLWQKEPGASWQASLQNITTNQCHGFADMQDLCEFLRQQEKDKHNVPALYPMMG